MTTATLTAHEAIQNRIAHEMDKNMGCIRPFLVLRIKHRSKYDISIVAAGNQSNPMAWLRSTNRYAQIHTGKGEQYAESIVVDQMGAIRAHYKGNKVLKEFKTGMVPMESLRGLAPGTYEAQLGYDDATKKVVVTHVNPDPIK